GSKKIIGNPVAPFSPASLPSPSSAALTRELSPRTFLPLQTGRDAGRFNTEDTGEGTEEGTGIGVAGSGRILSSSWTGFAQRPRAAEASVSALPDLLQDCLRAHTRAGEFSLKRP